MYANDGGGSAEGSTIDGTSTLPLRPSVVDFEGGERTRLIQGLCEGVDVEDDLRRVEVLLSIVRESINIGDGGGGENGILRRGDKNEEQDGEGAGREEGGGMGEVFPKRGDWRDQVIERRREWGREWERGTGGRTGGGGGRDEGGEEGGGGGGGGSSASERRRRREEENRRAFGGGEFLVVFG